MKNAEDIQILGNHLQHIGGIGIYTTGNGVRRITIENNLIDHIGDTAIEINGQWDVPNESNDHLIENNHIHHTGMLIPSARGIQIYNSSNDRVAHNLLHDIPKGAIGFGGSGTSNNLVEFNEIHSVLQDSQDMGPIYFGGVGPDNVIHNNYLHDVYGLFSYQGGIYMDQGTSGYTITNNLVENFGWQGGGRISGLIDASDIETVIRNNFLVLNNVHLSSAIFPREYSIEEAGTEANSAASTPPNDIDVIGNIFYNNDGPIYSFRFGSEGSWLRQSDMNLFFSDQGMYRVVGIPGVITLEDWQALADGRFDQNSLIADPLFVNVESSDYRLRFDSPAYGLGIEDIDQADVGLTADFPFESPDSSLHRMYITSDVAGNSANLHLAVGEKAMLTITARTASGYILDPGDYVQKCLSSEIDKVFVNHAGQIQAKEQGFAQVTCSVEANGVKLSLPVYVLVDTTVEEAAALVPPAALPDTQPAYLEELERIDFDTNEGLIDHWPSYNSWEIVHEDGTVMYCGYEEETGTHMSFGSMGWTDYQVDVRLRIAGEPNAAADIRQREGWGDDSHHYVHTLNSGADGQWVSQIYCDSDDCSAWKSINTPIERGEWIQFRAEVEGTMIRTYLNGRLVLTQYLDFTSVGNAGMRARPGTTLCIDDITVRSLDRSAEALDRASTAQSGRSQPVYLWPGEDQKVIGQLPGGVEVYLLDEDQEWAYIRLDGSGLQGWVPIQGLEMP
ncbi:MAG: right-handed parallel beta-helix repeat-containing protein [Anaerolineales bacterium]